MRLNVSISIITPTLNQGRFLEEAIDSVLSQGYPNLQYIVIDGGSEDETMSILERYRKWMSVCVSEKDDGQSDAIRKGFSRVTGEVWNWLNGDDRLRPGALEKVAETWRAHACDAVIGACVVAHVPHGRQELWRPKAPEGPSAFVRPGGQVMPQPSTFLSVKKTREVDGVRRELDFIMDWDLYLRLSMQGGDDFSVREVPEVLAISLRHEEAKSSLHAAGFRTECLQRLLTMSAEAAGLDRWRLGRAARRLRLELRLEAEERQEGVQSLGGILRALARNPDLVLDTFFLGAIRRASPWRFGGSL